MLRLTVDFSISSMIFIIIVACCFCLLYFLYYGSKPRYKIPPGLKEIPMVKGLPIIGILHRVKPTIQHFLLELGKSYGPIFRINFGMREMIVLNDFDTIKKSLIDKKRTFAGRMRLKGFDHVTHNSGILFEDGEKWAKQRSFVLKVLSEFGLGKSKSASIVQNECIFLLEELDKREGKPVDFESLISVYTANIISKFIMNKRFNRGDPKLDVISKVVTESLKQKDPIILLHFLLPILDEIEWIMNFTHSNKYHKAYDIFQQEIKDHLSALDFESEGEDLMDRFLIEQNNMKKKTGSVDIFTDWQLIRSSFELFVAGYETTSTTLGWSLMFMSRFPEIQNKVYDEIISQIGDERLTTMNDKKSLNYTQAVMDEILRWSTAIPIALYHRVLKDCSINGYFIPKNSIVIPNLFASHFDPKVWEKPDQFYPEHFLHVNNDDGMKYNIREELIPFSMGKRQCLGESLARMEYFMFFTSIIQKFHVRFVDELTDDRYQEVLQGNDTLIRTCILQDFTFRRRT